MIKQDKVPHIIIIGHVDEDIKFQIRNLFLNIVSNEPLFPLEAPSEMGVVETHEFKVNKILEFPVQVVTKDDFFTDGKSVRNKRRTAERKAKKNAHTIKNK